MKTINLFVHVIVCFIVISLSSSYCYAFVLKKDSCGSDHLTIYFSDYEDYRIGCCGYKYAKKFFTSYGYSVDVPITIHFEPSIIIDGCNDGYNRESVYGYSNPNSMTIHIRSLTSPLISNQEREYFRIKYDKKDWILSDLRLQTFHGSVVAHEVAHLFAQHNFNQQSNENQDPSSLMGRGVQEYIASVAQLSLFDYKVFLNYDILQKYERSIKFDYEEQINSALFSISPQEFVIMSFRHFQSLSRAEQKIFLDRIISGELNPDLNFDLVNNKRNLPNYCTYLK
jgi:hypothetical protein